MIYIVIGAYKAHKFIEECLESVKRQTMPCRVLLGVDGCKQTLKAVEKIMHNYDMDVYYYPENKGVYITINSLIKHVPIDSHYIWFGADDIMDEQMVEIMYENRPCFSKYSAIHILSKRDFNKLGGFMPWRCAADTEFRQRLYKVRPDHKALPQMYTIREHPGQLTKQKATKFGSKQRAEHQKYITDTEFSKKVKIRAVRHDQEVKIVNT